MQKTLVLILLTIFFSKGALAENNYFLMLKNNKVNVRYGPDLNSPIKYIYNKKNYQSKLLIKKKILEE